MKWDQTNLHYKLCDMNCQFTIIPVSTPTIRIRNSITVQASRYGFHTMVRICNNNTIRIPYYETKLQRQYDFTTAIRFHITRTITNSILPTKSHYSFDSKILIRFQNTNISRINTISRINNISQITFPQKKIVTRGRFPHVTAKIKNNIEITNNTAITISLRNYRN